MYTMDECNCLEFSIDYSLCLSRCNSPGLPSKPFPYIGLYIATASMACFIAVAADLFHAILNKNQWIPSKYFSMNAATLTLLAVALKLPMDITTEMISDADNFTKCGGIIMITSALATFMPSLASINRKNIWQNMTALGILIITLCVNSIIQMFTYMVNPLLYSLSLCFLIAQCLLLISSALSASVTKSYLDLKYHILHNQIPGVGVEIGKARFCVKSLRKFVLSSWVMAKSGNPVFVMVRSATCLATSILSGVLSLLHAIAAIFTPPQLGRKGDTDYGWSIPLIHVTQLLFILGCLITLLLRSKFIVSSFSNKACINLLRYTCSIEEYWTKGMIEWKHRPLVCLATNRTCRKIIQDIKILVINICITMQMLIVVLSKFAVLSTYLVLRPLYFCIHLLKIQFCSSNNQNELDAETGIELSELKGYVLLLEGEFDLSQGILKGICSSLDQVIRMGAKQQKGQLLQLISGNIVNLNSLLEFDSDEVESLHPEEPPRCWSLSISSLTSIAVSLSTIGSKERRKLLQSVDDGIFYVRSIEKHLDSKNKLVNTGKAADVVWNGVKLKYEWLEKGIQGRTVQEKNGKEILQQLAKNSKELVMGLKASTRNNISMESPLHWPKKVIVANSMYKVSQSLVLQCENGNIQSDEHVFKKIVKMIADIFVVCLTNLPRAISTMCYSSTIEEREKTVKEAAHLLGATQNILKFLNRHIDFPILPDHDGSPYIDEWRAFIKKHNAMSPTVSNNNNNNNNNIVSDKLIRSKSI